MQLELHKITVITHLNQILLQKSKQGPSDERVTRTCEGADHKSETVKFSIEK